MKKNILFVYPSMSLGGSTTSLLALLKALDPKKYNIDLQLFRNEGSLMEMLPDYVNVLPEGQLYKGPYAKYIKRIKFIFNIHFVKLLKDLFFEKGQGKASIISNFSAKELSRQNKKHYDFALGFLEGWSNRYVAFNVSASKKITWLHSTFKNITSYPRGEVCWMKAVDHITFVAEACREDFLMALPEMEYKTLLIPNIIDSDIVKCRSKIIDAKDEMYLHYVESRTFKIITVCRLQIKTKGLDRVIESAAVLKQKGYNFIWYILGDGEDREQLASMIDEADLSGYVVLTGARLNPYPFIAASDIMCMPSRYEGKPMAVTESMILGTPPVVTEYLSAHEQIVNHEEGLIVKNDDEAIADALAYCIDNEEKVYNMKKILSRREYGNKNLIEEIEKEIFV